MGNKTEETSEETSEKVGSSQQESETEKSPEKPESPDHTPVQEGKEGLETDDTVQTETEEITTQDENKVLKVEEDGEQTESADGSTAQNLDHGKEEHNLQEVPVELPEPPVQKFESSDSVDSPQEKEVAEVGTSESPLSMQPKPSNMGDNVAEDSNNEPGESPVISDLHENVQVETKEENEEEERVQAEESLEGVSSVQPEASDDSERRDLINMSVLHSAATEDTNSIDQSYNEPLSSAPPPNDSSEVVSELVLPENEPTVKENERDHLANDVETKTKEQHLSSVRNVSDSDSMLELERVKREMKMMEAALQGAARQAQVFHLLH